MLPSPNTTLAAVVAPVPGSLAALLLPGSYLAALVALAREVVRAVPVITDSLIRWQEHRSRMRRERVVTTALEQRAREDPESVLARLSPRGDPLAPAGTVAEPAPPAVQQASERPRPARGEPRASPRGRRGRVHPARLR